MSRRRFVPRRAFDATERPGRLLGLVDLHLIPDVVERVRHLAAEPDRPRLIAAEERDVVAVEAVADGLDVAFVAAGRVLVVALIPGPRDGIVAVDAWVAPELVRHPLTLLPPEAFTDPV